jgi:hypothetical protein
MCLSIIQKKRHGWAKLQPKRKVKEKWQEWQEVIETFKTEGQTRVHDGWLVLEVKSANIMGLLLKYKTSQEEIR